MEKKVNKKARVPSKEDLVTRLMDIVDGYDGTAESVVKPNETIRAIEVLSKMLGYLEPERKEIVTDLKFKLGSE